MVSFDSDGTPAFIAVTDANFVFRTVIDKSECLCEISNAKFKCLFENFVKKHTSEELGCPFLQLTQIVYSDSTDNRF